MEQPIRLGGGRVIRGFHRLLLVAIGLDRGSEAAASPSDADSKSGRTSPSFRWTPARLALVCP